MVRNVVSLVVIGVLAVPAAVARPASAAHGVRPIIGGSVAPEGKFPWAVRLSMGCGGALTAPRVVLTAGHCVDGTGETKTISVVAGVSDLKSPQAVTAHSERVIRADGFETETRGDDWAVIRLDHPLGLPTLPLAMEMSEKSTYVVMGWGQIREDSLKQERRLHFADVPIVPDGNCAVAYRKAGVKLVADDSVCAGSPTADTCQGDSGGPMVGRDVLGDWVQVGITSWGLGCARDGYPGVYTQITKFRADITAATKKLSEPR
ncbi:serine protease [Actinoplanes sp. TBRC 11911]|uniref:S1 family peptidase n=1 Tax=Actinoplanes sp. TBRC 11911 TaxID=2729386 RepID=UPI00145D116A|nr:serine protease [Actinoplanes sp. TBRC 11911]NMO50392.1 serine protease [Actinoplanes sp. TBRC 11911]